jgi:hypothetical protein
MTIEFTIITKLRCGTPIKLNVKKKPRRAGLLLNPASCDRRSWCLSTLQLLRIFATGLRQVIGLLRPVRLRIATRFAVRQPFGHSEPCLRSAGEVGAVQNAAAAAIAISIPLVSIAHVQLLGLPSCCVGTLPALKEAPLRGRRPMPPPMSSALLEAASSDRRTSGINGHKRAPAAQQYGGVGGHCRIAANRPIPLPVWCKEPIGSAERCRARG